MSHKLEESYKDFELLSLEWDKIDKSLLESKKVNTIYKSYILLLINSYLMLYIKFKNNFSNNIG